MTQSPPPDRPPSPRRSLTTDDFIGILVAFASIGGILFWALSRDNQGFNLSFLEPTPTPQATTNPFPWLDQSPASSPSIAPSPTRTVAPEAIAPVQTPPPVTAVPAPVPVQPASPPATPPAATSFTDVPANYWAAPFLAELGQRNVIKRYPDGTFKPDQPITRAEFADMIGRAFDQPQQQQPTSFGDIPTDFWAKGAIDEAVKMGFMNGYPDNVFRPDQLIPKYQALIALTTGLGLQAPQNPTQTLVYYQDANQLPNYAIVKVAAATNAGLVVNHPDLRRLEPNQDVTRAEAAALIHQALARSGKVVKINSVYVVPPQP